MRLIIGPTLFPIRGRKITCVKCSALFIGHTKDFVKFLNMLWNFGGGLLPVPCDMLNYQHPDDPSKIESSIMSIVDPWILGSTQWKADWWGWLLNSWTFPLYLGSVSVPFAKPQQKTREKVWWGWIWIPWIPFLWGVFCAHQRKVASALNYLSEGNFTLFDYQIPILIFPSPSFWQKPFCSLFQWIWVHRYFMNCILFFFFLPILRFWKKAWKES